MVVFDNQSKTGAVQLTQQRHVDFLVAFPVVGVCVSLFGESSYFHMQVPGCQACHGLPVVLLMGSVLCTL